jgi:hypothetical protein
VRFAVGPRQFKGKSFNGGHTQMPKKAKKKKKH